MATMKAAKDAESAAVKGLTICLGKIIFSIRRVLSPSLILRYSF
jgi:hypothetical protein